MSDLVAYHNYYIYTLVTVTTGRPFVMQIEKVSIIIVAVIVACDAVTCLLSLIFWVVLLQRF